MSLQRWSLVIAVCLPLFSFLSLAGCGEAPSDAPPPAEMTPEEAQSYEEQMRKTNGRG
jgi:hypothetical protein